jgi:formaldehyde-activating enzyme involved in methanogenesis
VTVGGVPLAVAGGVISSSSVVLFDKTTASDVVVVVGKALCVTCNAEDSDKAESALCKTDNAFSDPVDSG